MLQHRPCTEIRQCVADNDEGDVMFHRSEVVELLDYIDELEDAILRLSADNTRVNDLYDHAAEERDQLLERVEALSSTRRGERF